MGWLLEQYQQEPFGKIVCNPGHRRAIHLHPPQLIPLQQFDVKGKKEKEMLSTVHCASQSLKLQEVCGRAMASARV